MKRPGRLAGGKRPLGRARLPSRRFSGDRQERMEVPVVALDAVEGLLHDLDRGDVRLADQPSELHRRRERGHAGRITPVAAR